MVKKSATIKNPSLNAVEPPNPRNLGLQAALARYLQRQSFPKEHGSIQNHPLYVHFGSLSAERAGLAVKSMLLLLAAALAWRFRRGWNDSEKEKGLAPEWAAVTLLCALLSPLCWKQHLVLALPCAFLVFWDHLEGRRPRWSRTAALIAAAAIVIFTKRFAAGQQFSILLMTYKLDTLVVLLLMLWTLTSPIRRKDAASISAASDDSQMPRAARTAA